MMSLRQICNAVLYRHARLQNALAKRLVATESKGEIVDISADEKPVYAVDDGIQEEIARKRNKSRLNPHHRNILMGVRPYDSTREWYHNTVKYKKRMLGRYGLKGNDEPVGFAWPTPDEVEDAREYERVAYPLSLQESWKQLEEKRRAKAEQRQLRENEILEKVGKMEQWTADLQAKIDKKQAELDAARLRKERLIEEVRDHFGFKISPNDERFKQLLEQKEKESKKKKKEAKKQAKLERLQNKLQREADSAKSATTEERTIEPTKSAE